MGADAVLSYSVFLAMHPTFDLGKAHSKASKSNRDGFNMSNSLGISSLSHHSASHPLT